MHSKCIQIGTSKVTRIWQRNPLLSLFVVAREFEQYTCHVMLYMSLISKFTLACDIHYPIQAPVPPHCPSWWCSCPPPPTPTNQPHIVVSEPISSRAINRSIFIGQTEQRLVRSMTTADRSALQSEYIILACRPHNFYRASYEPYLYTWQRFGEYVGDRAEF